ncbi:MAG: hypothetical protein K8R74_16595 [Bacteroidales bacterium]|nr:hypothetical protein [Bacteroidales bacterium]
MKIKLIMKSWIQGLLLLLSVIIISCDKDNKGEPPPSTNYSDGVFIINEGLFNTGTGTISFMKRDGSAVQHKIYQQANNSIPLGNIVQSMNKIDDKAFIVVNNADKVEIVNIENFKRIKTLNNIIYPAYIIQADSNKAYISCWDKKLVIISLHSLEVVGSVITGTGPTKMLKTDNHVWVLNQGGLGLDSTITIVDISTDEVAQTIQVYPRPTGIQEDKNGNIWIMCSGRGSWHGEASEGHLVCIDPIDHSIIYDFEFPGSAQQPEKLIINSEGDILYYNYPGGVYQFDINTSSLETSPLIARSGMFYSLGFDPKESIIYVSDPVDYVQRGWVFRYDALTGITIDSLKAGIVPTEYLLTKKI